MSDIFVHSSSHVEKGAKIGQGSKIWINTQIRSTSTVGENCIISKDVYIDANVKIGNRYKIQNGVSIYHGVIIEDDVFVGPNACFTNDKTPRAFNQDWNITQTLVKIGASIGANATIVCGITLGQYSMVAAGSVVTKDVKPYSLVMGNPAKHYSYVDKSGNKVNEKD